MSTYAVTLKQNIKQSLNMINARTSKIIKEKYLIEQNCGITPINF